jgi:hypothetical protein
MEGGSSRSSVKREGYCLLPLTLVTGTPSTPLHDSNSNHRLLIYWQSDQQEGSTNYRFGPVILVIIVSQYTVRYRTGKLQYAIVRALCKIWGTPPIGYLV